MATENLYRDIKSFNQKVRRLAAKYGTESIQYKQLISDVQRNFPMMTHKTKQGVLQINNPKKPKFNQYQKQILVKLKGRKGVKEIEQAAKKRIQADKGAKYKPTKAEIEKEVRDFTARQNKFDKTLDLIYKHETAGDLPIDISDIYSKLHRQSGSGVTNADIDYMEEKMEEFENLRNELDEILPPLYQLQAANPNYRIPDIIRTNIQQCITGEKTVDDIKVFIDKLKDYITEVQNSDNPQTVDFE